MDSQVLAAVHRVTSKPAMFTQETLTGDSDTDMLSDGEREHAIQALQGCAALAELRYSLCPSKMSESSFWRRYFELLAAELVAGGNDLGRSMTPISVGSSDGFEVVSVAASPMVEDVDGFAMIAAPLRGHSPF